MQKHFSSAAIICEYNPFHHGHAYQIAELKKQSDVIVGVMSGAFVQRGTVAVADKYSRAAAAIEGGMDLVLELPFPYCCAAAPDFATAGAYIASAIGVSALAFGCEDGEDKVLPLAEAMASGTLQKTAKALIKEEKSLSYPRALQIAAANTFGEGAAEAIAKPNNILAAEYISAIKRERYTLTPYPMQRDMSYLSSSAIRENADFSGLIPFPSYFEGERRDIKHIEKHVLLTLRTVKGDSFYGIDKALFSRLQRAARTACSIEELVAAATDKVCTAARARRAILAILLDIKAEDVKARPAYTSLLAANEKGKAYLRSVKKTALIPIITKPASYKKHPDIVPQFEKALAAEELAAACTEGLKPYGTAITKTPRC